MAKGPWKRISDIRAANKRAGHHFFDPSTMRAFGSRVYPHVYGGRYFVTSEQPPHGPRVYAVRRAADDGIIPPGSTTYPSLAAARAAASRLGSEQGSARGQTVRKTTGTAKGSTMTTMRVRKAQTRVRQATKKIASARKAQTKARTSLSKARTAAAKTARRRSTRR